MIRFSTFKSTPIPIESESLKKQVAAEYGFVPNLIAGMAPAPETLQSYLALSKLFGASSLSPEEQQIVLLTTSRTHECEYGTSAHSMTAEQTSLDWKTIEKIRNREPLENERYEALRQFTERVVKNVGVIPRDDWSQFVSVGFDARNALDVVLGVTLETLTNSVNHMVETPLDEQFTKRAWSSDEKKTTVNA